MAKPFPKKIKTQKTTKTMPRGSLEGKVDITQLKPVEGVEIIPYFGKKSNKKGYDSYISKIKKEIGRVTAYAVGNRVEGYMAWSRDFSKLNRFFDINNLPDKKYYFMLIPGSDPGHSTASDSAGDNTSSDGEAEGKNL